MSNKLISWKQFNDALNANHFAERGSPILSDCNQDDPDEVSYSYEQDGCTYETTITLADNIEKFAPEGVDVDENTPLIPISEAAGVLEAFPVDSTGQESAIRFFKLFNPFGE